MKVGRILACTALMVTAVALMGASGCKKGGYKLISGVGYSVEPNLETIKVQMNFAPDVQSDMGGSYPIKDYGTIEIEPSSPDRPFNVGFRVNTAVFNDQDYVHFEPTRYLPSGQPIPATIDRALAQITLKKETGSNYDVYAYLDVAKAEWFGLAVTMKFLNQKNFPAGLSISQQFVKGKDGFSRVSAAVFGPRLDDKGNMIVPGGIAMFANIKGLITDVRSSNQFLAYDGKEKTYFFDGPSASYYRRDPRRAINVGEAFKAALRLNSRR
jgi:hypothetical protein